MSMKLRARVREVLEAPANYIGTIVAATVPIKVSNTINHGGRLLTYIGNRQI